MEEEKGEAKKVTTAEVTASGNEEPDANTHLKPKP